MTAGNFPPFLSWVSSERTPVLRTDACNTVLTISTPPLENYGLPNFYYSPFSESFHKSHTSIKNVFFFILSKLLKFLKKNIDKILSDFVYILIQALIK